MGMSIEEAIEYNKNLKMYMEINDKYDEYKFLKENYIALNMAINTMRKYQKIQEIVEHWACCGNPSDSMIAISEVVEDGSENNYHASNS